MTPILVVALLSRHNRRKAVGALLNVQDYDADEMKELKSDVREMKWHLKNLLPEEDE